MSAIDHNVLDARTPKVAGLSPVARRAAISSALGSALEWIDFTAYGAVAATVLPAQFFPTMDPSSAILASFATFGVGFFARPAGGVVLGILGDKLGRKKVLLFTLVLMGVASFLIGCLPTYTSIGLWAPGLLVLFRFMQGFALGGEATGAQLLTMEHAPADQRGLFGSFINIGAPASQVLANLLLFLITASMTTEQFMSFGWRIPFLMSLLLVALGVYIRLKVEETPAFEHMKAHETSDKTGATRRASPLSVLRTHGGTVLRLMLFWAAPSACFYVVTVFSLGYLTKTVGVSNQTAFLCLLGANLVAVFTTVIGGAASDRFRPQASVDNRFAHHVGDRSDVFPAPEHRQRVPDLPRDVDLRRKHSGAERHLAGLLCRAVSDLGSLYRLRLGLHRCEPGILGPDTVRRRLADAVIRRPSMGSHSDVRPHHRNVARRLGGEPRNPQFCTRSRRITCGNGT